MVRRLRLDSGRALRGGVLWPQERRRLRRPHHGHRASAHHALRRGRARPSRRDPTSAAVLLRGSFPQRLTGGLDDRVATTAAVRCQRVVTSPQVDSTTSPSPPPPSSQPSTAGCARCGTGRPHATARRLRTATRSASCAASPTSTWWRRGEGEGARASCGRLANSPISRLRRFRRGAGPNHK